MNHIYQYYKIINNAKSENRKKLKKENVNYIYYEKHHIIPRCLNGSEEKENKVLLTAKEHYVCHKLLTYIYKGNRKIANAFQYMTFSKKLNKHIKCSRDYLYARELCSLNNSGKKNSMFGRDDHCKGLKKWVKENGNIISKNTTKQWKNKTIEERKSPRKGKTNEEFFGEERAKEINDKISKNTKLSMQKPDVKQKMRKKHIIINKRKPIKVICPYCNKEGETGAMHVWHFEKCKHKPK